MKAKYEYRVFHFDKKWNAMGSKLGTDFVAIEKKMNELGAEGWELVKVSELLGGRNMGMVVTVAIIATFKRTAA
jgi:hypothetical protein